MDEEDNGEGEKSKSKKVGEIEKGLRGRKLVKNKQKPTSNALEDAVVLRVLNFLTIRSINSMITQEAKNRRRILRGNTIKNSREATSAVSPNGDSSQESASAKIHIGFLSM